MNLTTKRLLPLLLSLSCIHAASFHEKSMIKQELHNRYEQACRQPTDISEHVATLRGLASECSSVIEIGVRNIVSTWGIVQGLTESQSDSPSYIGIDIDFPHFESIVIAKYLAEESGITFNFLHNNVMNIDICPAEMLFIDSLHIYCHLTYELEKFSPKISKYIVMHDTAAPWGFAEDVLYRGDYSEYPPEFDRTKKGLWIAVEDFLKRHPEWVLHKHHFHCHGLTILKRVVGDPEQFARTNQETLPEPYKSVKLLPFDPHGWYRNKTAMEQLFRQQHPQVVVEVGCWFGLSTRHIASLLPKGGILYAVDHWLGSTEHQPGQPVWHPKLPNLYEQFLSNVIHARLTDKIIPLKLSSIEASKALANSSPDLIYIDASHEYISVCSDIEAWFPLVKGHGILCGDDYLDGDGSIKRAVDRFALENNLIVHNVDSFWYYEEK